MNIGDKYRFKISVPTLGIVEVFPVNDTLTWKFTKGDDIESFTKELDTQLTFVDDTAKLTGPLTHRQDFTYIYDIERARNRCFRVQLFIEQRCDVAAPFVPYWNGYFTMRDCSFDVERCRVDVSLKQNVPTDCMLENWDREENFLVTETIINDTGYEGQINESILCTFTYNHPIGYYQVRPQIEEGNCLGVVGSPTTEAWTEFSIIGTYNGDGTWNVKTRWIREELSLSVNPGPPWISIGTNLWGRPPALQLVREEFFSDNFVVEYELIYPEGGYTNGRLLSEILIALFEEVCPGSLFVSNFLNINPDGSAPANSYYADSATYMDNLALFPAHDQAKTDETEASFRIDQWSLEDMITDLRNIFNLKFFFDGTTYFLEHLSYGSLIAGIDLTTDEGKKYISGKWQYSYDKSKLFKKESWSLPVQSGRNEFDRNDFRPVPIRYSSACLDKKSSEKTTVIQLLFMDYSNIVGNESFIGSHLFILTTLDASDKIRIDNGYFTVQPKLNGRLGMPWLHEMFWDFGRPLPDGEMNHAVKQFTGLEKIRKQTPIFIQMCCEDFNTNFDPNGIVRTQLGDGELDEATYDEQTERLTLTLKHD